MLHDLEVPLISSLSIWDKILTVASFAVFGCTELEAVRLGKYLQETLKCTNRWLDKNYYGVECDKLGFSQKMPPTPESSRFEYSQYLLVAQKWHLKIAKVKPVGKT